ARRVAVSALGEAQLAASLQERSLPHDQLLWWMPTNRQRALAPVPLIIEIEVPLGPLECGQALLPRPPPQPTTPPLLEIVGLPPQGDARIHRRRPAHDAPPRKRKQEPLHAGRPMPIPPVVPDHRVAPRIDQVARQRRPRIVWPRLEQQHLTLRPLRHPRRDDGTGGPRTHDHEPPHHESRR